MCPAATKPHEVPKLHFPDCQISWGWCSGPHQTSCASSSLLRILVLLGTRCQREYHKLTTGRQAGRKSMVIKLSLNTAAKARAHKRDKGRSCQELSSGGHEDTGLKQALGAPHGGPVVKTLRFQCRAHRFDPCFRDYDPTCCGSQKQGLKNKIIFKKKEKESIKSPICREYPIVKNILIGWSKNQANGIKEKEG